MRGPSPSLEEGLISSSQTKSKSRGRFDWFESNQVQLARTQQLGLRMSSFLGMILMWIIFGGHVLESYGDIENNMRGILLILLIFI